MPHVLKISILQVDVALGDPPENFSRIARQVAVAVSAGAEMIVLPELWSTGYALDQLANLAEDESGSTLDFLRSLARQYGIYIVGGSILERDGADFYNTCFVLNAEGLVQSKYRKEHLFGPLGELNCFKPGLPTLPFASPWGKIGLLICFDLRFPETARALTLAGAHLIIMPAEFPKPKLLVWQTLARARAIENQLFFIAANRVGRDLTSEYFGHSTIIDPLGTILAEGSEAAEIISAELDLTLVARVRQDIECLPLNLR